MKFTSKSVLLAAAACTLPLITTGTAPYCERDRCIPEYERKPVYNIAHMVNSIEKMQRVMKLGANGIQIDVEFDKDGVPTDAHFGSVCNCMNVDCDMRAPLSDLFDYIRNTTKDDINSHQLAIVVLHLKAESFSWDVKEVAGIRLAEKLLRHLWYGVSVPNLMNVLVSVKQMSETVVLEGVNSTVWNNNRPPLLKKLGFDVRDESDLNSLKILYNSWGRDGNYWVGDGASTCTQKTWPDDRLQAMLDQRDTEAYDRYIKKVYRRTVDLPVEMDRSLRRGVDAIITNRPGRLNHLIKYKYYPMMRLATLRDSPWTRFDGWTPSLRQPPNVTVLLGDEVLDIVHGVND